MTALRYFCRRKSGWISWGLLGIVFSLGSWRLGAQSAPQAVLLGTPTEEIPGPKKRILPAAAQKAKPLDSPYSEITLRLDVPGPEILFRMESEEGMRERIRQENKGKMVEFPDSRIVLSKTPISLRDWSSLEEMVEPYYTVYRRLYFEQINADRYGWDFGYFHPLIATGTFWFDLATLPFQLVAEPCRRFEYNTGLCLPGDPVPLLLYPPHPK
jgi:hypothetical protein